MTGVSDHGFPSDDSEFEVELRFDQEDFDLFAELSGDNNPIHVDPAFAATTRFGHTVAHGMLLFGVANAAINGWIGGRLNLHEQQLVFPAPTFADEKVILRLEIHPDQAGVRRRVEAAMRTASGETFRGQALVGFDELTTSNPYQPAAPAEAVESTVLRVGMRADRDRVFAASDIEAFVELTGDPHPGLADSPPMVPPALLGGAISDLLGVSLPGPGSNWLKQTYRFHRHVHAGNEIRSSVAITRLRPLKDLVNLRTDLDIDAGTVVSGGALLLVSDVADRSGGVPQGSEAGA